MAQHRLLIMEFRVRPKDKRVKHVTAKSGSGDLIKLCTSQKFALTVGDQCRENEFIQDYGDRFQASIIGATRALLGLSESGQKCDKETWWENDTLQGEVKMKKALFENWQATKSTKDRDAYILANLSTKRAVARAR